MGFEGLSIVSSNKQTFLPSNGTRGFSIQTSNRQVFRNTVGTLGFSVSISGINIYTIKDSLGNNLDGIEVTFIDVDGVEPNEVVSSINGLVYFKTNFSGNFRIVINDVGFIDFDQTVNLTSFPTYEITLKKAFYYRLKSVNEVGEQYSAVIKTQHSP